MSQIHILDGQKDIILDYITAKNIYIDNHKKSLEDTLETYDFITFANKRFSQFLEKRNRIIIPDEDGTLREFVIFENARYSDTEGRKIQTFAHASYLELKKAAVVYPSKFKGTASQHGGRALNGTGWSIGLVEVDGDITININEHIVPYDYLKRIAKEFDGELSFRIEHDGSKVTGRYVDVLERVGTWQGREVEFGKDLDSIRRVEKQDIVTALLGLGPEREDGTRIEVLVEDNDALQRWGRIDEHGELQHLIEPYEIQSERSEMTLTEARRYTRTALDKRINTQITYETTILDLEEVAGHENKKIRFGDTIKIKDTKFNPPLYLEARVFEMTRSIKRKDKKDIKLGDFIEHTEEDVNAIWNQLKKEIQNRVSFYEMAEYTYDKLTIDDKDETVFEDGKTFAEATGIQAREDAKAFAVEEDAKIRTDVETEIIKLDEQSERYAQSALEQAKMYAVSKEVYDNQMTQIANDIEDRAPLEYVDGKFTVVEDDLEKFSAEIEKKADGNTVYTIEDVDNMINNTVSKTQYTTDMNGIVTDLESQGTRIGQNEKAIGLKADSSQLDAVENSLNTKIGNVEVTAEGAKMTASEVRADLDGLEIGGRNLVTLSNVSKSHANVDGYKYTLTKTSSSGNPYIRVSDEVFEDNTEYVVTFKVRKISGDVHYMGGHSTVAVHSSTKIYLDGELVTEGGMGWSNNDGKSVYPNDNKTHQFMIKFKTVDDVASVSNARWYIQPNRLNYGDDFVVEIWDWQIEKGNKATDYRPAYEDTDEAINEVSGRVTSAEGEIKTLAGEVSLKASKSVVDSLENRVSTAEGDLKVLPGEINAKVSKDGAFGELNLSPDKALLDFERVNVTGKLEAKHIKSLAGLNVNDQFVVDTNGNVRFAGDLQGATGTFRGKVEAAQLVIDNPDLETKGATGLKLELAMIQENTSKPFKKTGYALFKSEYDGIEIYKENLNGNTVRLDHVLFETRTVLLNGKLQVGEGGMGGSEFGVEFPRLHSISASPNEGNFSFYGNRARGQRPFTVRSHLDGASGSGNNSYRDDMYIGASTGALYLPHVYKETSSNSANVRIGASGQLYRSSSAEKHKILVEDIDFDYNKILELYPKHWFDKNECERMADNLTCEYNKERIDKDIVITPIKRIAGLSADDVHKLGLGMYCDYNDEGEVEGLQYDRLLTLLIPVVRDLKNELEELKSGNI